MVRSGCYRKRPQPTVLVCDTELDRDVDSTNLNALVTIFSLVGDGNPTNGTFGDRSN